MDTIEHYSQRAKQNLIYSEHGPCLLCNWVNFVFIHYEVDKDLLQAEVPYPIDLYNERAFVSLVAFTLEQFRFAKGGRLTQWMMAPVASHRYFNVRTYVKHKEMEGIYFIKEWISNHLCAYIGAWMYQLPCEYGVLEYNHKYLQGQLDGRVRPGDRSGHYRYRVRTEWKENVKRVRDHSMDEFLLERYVAFVKGREQGTYFRIWHKPWMQAPIDIEVIQDDLMDKLGAWGKQMKMVKAHYSPGVYGVWMGRPHKVEEF